MTAGKKKTHEEYVLEVENINPNIEVLEIYVNARTKILHKCKTCEHKWMAIPHNILHREGCPKCSGSAKKTHSQYVYEVAKVNSNIEVVDKYINRETKILHKCKTCEYKWMARPKNILQGSGCPKCSGVFSANKTHEQYVEEVSKINPNIEVIGSYINTNTKILHRCKTCGYIWKVKPKNIMQGHGCHICNGCDCVKKTHEQYVKEVNSINSNIEVIGIYNGDRKKILHKCKSCKHEWLASPNHILRKRGCPECNMSHGERDIAIYLLKHKIKYISQYKFDDCRNKNPLPFDFYLPEYNTCIEYNGIQHYKAVDWFGGEEGFEYRKFNDDIKMQYCIGNNINLLRIKYYEDVEEKLNEFFEEHKLSHLVC